MNILTSSWVRAMNNIAFWVSLAYILTIPGEVLVEDPVWGSASRIAGLILALVWVAVSLVSKKIRRPVLFHGAVLLFVLWNGISVFWSADEIRSAQHFATWFQLLIMAYVLWDIYTTRARILAGLQAYIVGCYVIIGSAILNFISNTTYYYGRFSAQNTNPDDLGIILAIGIPVAWYLAASRDVGTMARLRKAIDYAFLPLAMFAIALSSTRTALAATIPGIAFGLISLTRVKLPVRMTIFVLLLFALFKLYSVVPQLSVDRLSTTASELAGGDLNGRISLWRQGLTAFTEHPFLGVGSDMYRWTNVEGKVAHNSFISVLVENGIFGLLFYGAILLIVTVCALAQPSWERGLWISVLMTWLIGASALTWEFKKPTWLFFSLIVAASSLAVPSLETALTGWKRGPVIQPTESSS
jgi:O-antigen ligase